MPQQNRGGEPPSTSITLWSECNLAAQKPFGAQPEVVHQAPPSVFPLDEYQAFAASLADRACENVGEPMLHPNFTSATEFHGDTARHHMAFRCRLHSKTKPYHTCDTTLQVVHKTLKTVLILSDFWYYSTCCVHIRSRQSCEACMSTICPL